MKNIFDGWLKDLVQESNAVILLHLHRLVETLFYPKSLAPLLGILVIIHSFCLQPNYAQALSDLS